ncbi:MAG: tail fiber domain-containing protein [Candidatus Tenebribacter burtonii]|nr:tail fiber domain-containing protein [Candidatus Tenebribacter burtonii]
MKNLFILFLLITTLCLWAQVPQTIDYQGRLADSDGNYLNGVYSVEFDLFEMETSGSALWIETHDVNVANGIFHVLLGSVNPFPAGLFNNQDLWLEFHVGAEILLPRTQIASVPYAIKAETAYTMEVPLNLSGNVSDPNSVITGENTGTGYGVYGKNDDSGNYGYLGGTYYGVYGHSYTSHPGVYGYNTSLCGCGVVGYSTDDMSFGGNFEGGMYGVFGMVIPGGDGSYWGVYGSVSGGTGTNYAVYGYTGGNYSTNYAGYFVGNLAYTGTLSNPSDELFKENVQPFSNALFKIKLMDVHTFNFIQMAEEKQLVLPKGEQIGLIAQELEEILPELVTDNVHSYDKNKGIEGAERDIERIEYKGINYIGLIPVLIEAMKEQQEQIEELQQQIRKLR